MARNLPASVMPRANISSLLSMPAAATATAAVTGRIGRFTASAIPPVELPPNRPVRLTELAASRKEISHRRISSGCPCSMAGSRSAMAQILRLSCAAAGTLSFLHA